MVRSRPENKDLHAKTKRPGKTEKSDDLQAKKNNPENNNDLHAKTKKPENNEELHAKTNRSDNKDFHTKTIKPKTGKDRNKMNTNPKSNSPSLLPTEDEKYGFQPTISYEGDGKDKEFHPLFRKNIFLLKILISLCLFLGVAIIFRNPSPLMDPARNAVKQTMDTEFQFAAVTNWYEKNFGKPLALLPFFDKKQTNGNSVASGQYAIPASGRILENFQKNGQGIMIETGKGAAVEAMNEGIVQFAGIKQGLGKTVIIQHSDQTESWYGNLQSIDVNLYQYVDKGKEVGVVSALGGQNQAKGEFYFAIKKGDQFIDPNQVIRFE